ncbi:MAG: hypothetical protein R6U96_17710 [Promethearchaeia archaeon]
MPIIMAVPKKTDKKNHLHLHCRDLHSPALTRFSHTRTRIDGMLLGRFEPPLNIIYLNLKIIKTEFESQMAEVFKTLN